LHALQPTLPHLSRSALHRCLQQRAISRLSEVGGDKPAKKRFKRYPIGYFHINLANVRTAEGKSNLFVAIDRTSKFAHLRLEKRAGKMEAAQFLRDLLQALPYRVHTVLTDNGIQFTNQALDAHAFAHIFDDVCSENGI
jgi:IS30 family transposase